MIENSKPVGTTVDEVRSAVDELKELGSKIKGYGEASQRLINVSDALQDVSRNVATIRDLFQTAAAQVAQTQANADRNVQSIDAMLQSMPDIVQRIEATDATAVAASLNQTMSDLGTRLQAHETVLAELAKRLESGLAQQGNAIRGLQESMEKGNAATERLTVEMHALQGLSTQGANVLATLNTAVNDEFVPRLQLNYEAASEIRGLVGQVQQNTNRAADNMAVYTKRMLDEMSALRSQLGSAQELLSEQRAASARHEALLEQISAKKKGWFS
ncbi:hypothetical protein [Bordetella trematum]|uniref:hypothetical protein n=1 Tax=Bordetella trematum TaxID=123899 RepID=UPI003AF36CB3